jgi:hypothetical protein
MKSKNERARQRSASYRTLIAQWCEKLAAHFNVELTELQIEVFLEELTSFSDFQLDQSFERCLNECQFMPRLSEIRQRIPERREPSTATGAYLPTGPPIADLNRPIAEKLCLLMHNRRYSSLDTIKDSKLIYELLRKANIVRYIQDGVDVSRWVSAEDAQELHALSTQVQNAA